MEVTERAGKRAGRLGSDRWGPTAFVTRKSSTFGPQIKTNIKEIKLKGLRRENEMGINQEGRNGVTGEICRLWHCAIVHIRSVDEKGRKKREINVKNKGKVKNEGDKGVEGSKGEGLRGAEAQRSSIDSFSTKANAK